MRVLRRLRHVGVAHAATLAAGRRRCRRHQHSSPGAGAGDPAAGAAAGGQGNGGGINILNRWRSWVVLRKGSGEVAWSRRQGPCPIDEDRAEGSASLQQEPPYI